MLFQDPGFGVHGLPYQAKNLLDETFIFECGHAVSKPGHFRALDVAKKNGSAVFSAFTPHSANIRQPVYLKDGKITLAETFDANCFVLAHPFIVDREYIKLLPSLNFDINKILTYYVSRGQLSYVMNDMPPEFDVVEEMDLVRVVYERYLLEVTQSEH